VCTEMSLRNCKMKQLAGLGRRTSLVLRYEGVQGGHISGLLRGHYIAR